MVSTINEGAPIIIAQGRDVGGHSGVGREASMGLAPAVVDAVALGADWPPRWHWAPRAFRWALVSPHRASRCGIRK